MSLRIGVLATYASQLYVAGVGLAVTPLYLRALGTEAYGLVGFFAMLLAWFQLLDVGLSPAVVRETSRFRGHALDALALRRTVRAVEILFLAVALAATLALILLAEPIALHWLRPEQLKPETIVEALWLTAGSIGLRFAAILYRAVITGFEQLSWLGGFNATIATLRAFAVLPAMAWWGATPRVFFLVQLAVSVVELGCLVARAYRCLPLVVERVGLSLAPLYRIARFSAAVAFTGALSVALTQSDRLLLSGMLPLGDYAHFNLAVLAASAVVLAGSPLTSALLPRLSAMQATGRRDDVRRLALLTTAVMSLATLPLAMVLAIHSHAVMLTWTAQPDAAQASASILALYALGNAVVAHLSLAYALQFAAGQLRLHVIGNALLVATLIPGQVLLTQHFGAVGAGAFWLAINVLYALAWTPVALRQIAPGILRPWLAGIARAVVVAAAAVGLTRFAWMALAPLNREASAAYLLASWASASVALLALSPQLRSPLVDGWRRRRGGVA